jgi:hypothetical protein
VKEHPCANDALEQAKKLIRFHDAGNHQDSEISDGTQAVEVGAASKTPDPEPASNPSGVFASAASSSALRLQGGALLSIYR